MNITSFIPGIFLFVVGMLLLAKPELIVKLQRWSQKVIMDADYKPGIKTIIMFRIMGIIFIVFGLIALLIAIFQK
jgi:uncharacterized membrane protein